MEDSIGTRLTELLNKNKMSAEELGIIIGTTKNTIYNIIKGKNTKVETIENISKALNVSLDYLVFGNEKYKDTTEIQLIEVYRELNEDNKSIAVGELMKLLTIQRINNKK